MAVKEQRSVGKPWIFEGNTVDSIEQFPSGSYGFIYKITCPDGTKYIGKKALHSYRTTYERVLNQQTGRMNKKKVVTATESNWKDYYSSNILLKKLVKDNGKEGFVREILRICPSKKGLTYWEMVEQCKADVLNPENGYLNDNILGKFFSKDFFE